MTFSTVGILLTSIAAWAATGVSFPLSALYGESLQASSYRLSAQQDPSLLNIRSKKEDIRNPKKLTILKSELPKNKRMLWDYVESKCIGEIIDNLHHIVKWNKVKDIELRKSIWRLYNKKIKIDIKLIGFMLIRLDNGKENLVASYVYDRIDIKKKYNEEGILAELGLSEHI